MSAARKEAFDLFAGLGSLSKRNLQWYEGLSDEGKKVVAPFVLMRWWAILFQIDWLREQPPHP